MYHDKKDMKRIITIMLAVVAFGAFAQESRVVIDGVEYIVWKNDHALASLTGNSSDCPEDDISIKESVIINGKTYVVTGLDLFACGGRRLFLPESITEILGLGGAKVDKLPESLELIFHRALSCAELPEEVTLPAIKTVGAYALSELKGVRKIRFGSNLSLLGACAFLGSDVSEIVFDDGAHTEYSFRGYPCISNHAFSYSNNLRELKLPKWEDMVLGDCIADFCDNLERVVFPDVPSIEYGYCEDFSDATGMIRDYPVFGYFFKDCPKLKEIVCLGETPMEIANIDNFKEKNLWVDNTAEEFTFMDNIDKCVLKVPAGSEALYRAHPVWGRFKTILGFENGDYESTAICAPEADDAACEPVYYNLQGMRVKDPVKGRLYIRAFGSKTDKVVY